MWSGSVPAEMAAVFGRDAPQSAVVRDYRALAHSVRSGGAVEVRLYPGSVAGDDVDVIRKMRLGTLNAAPLTSAGDGLAGADRSGAPSRVGAVRCRSEPRHERAREALDGRGAHTASLRDERGWQQLNAEYAKQFGIETPGWPPNAPQR